MERKTESRAKRAILTAHFKSVHSRRPPPNHATDRATPDTFTYHHEYSVIAIEQRRFPRKLHHYHNWRWNAYTDSLASSRTSESVAGPCDRLRRRSPLKANTQSKSFLSPRTGARQQPCWIPDAMNYFGGYSSSGLRICEFCSSRNRIIHKRSTCSPRSFG